MSTFASATRSSQTARSSPARTGSRCACGGAITANGECAACRAKRMQRLQAKLAIGGASDPAEREADRVAGDVLRGSDADVSRRAPVTVQRLRSIDAATPAQAPPIVNDALRAPGRPLDTSTRAYFEPRFGRDFSHVRVHDDGLARRSAQAVGALAYTVGRDVVLGIGRGAAHSPAGRALLAHELTHVLQQEGGAPRRVQRAIVRIGPLDVTVDYSSVITVLAADRPTRIASQINTLTGVAPTAAEQATINGLAESAQRWLLFGLKLISDNRAAAPALSMATAVQRLLAFAPSALQSPTPDPDSLFVHEVLTTSGWSETALAGRLPTPGAGDRAAVRTIVNPPTAAPGAALTVATFRSRLRPALEHFIRQIDPARIASVGTRSISAFRAIGDIIQDEARQFFAPYADAAIANIYDLQPRWRASANIFDTNAMVPTRDNRLSYLSNRAEIAGRNTDAANPRFIDTNIFRDTNFDGSRGADRAELFAIVTAVEADPAIQPIVDRLVQHTGQQSGTGPSARIGLVTRFDAGGTTACVDHWRGIDTVCHEVLHALVHANFVATAARVSFPQVIREGFTEVLGQQLFNDHIVPKANGMPAFKNQLETGVAGAPCPAPALGTVGYGAAGAGADTIRGRVGNNRFRAAYFLGRPDLAGLP